MKDYSNFSSVLMIDMEQEDRVMITKEKIRSGIEEHLVSFCVDPNMKSGIVCQIGDCWFYVGGVTTKEMNPDEYVANISIADIVDAVFDVLEDFREDVELKDEYDYYDAVLTYRNGYS